MADLLFDQATKYLCRTYPQRQGDRMKYSYKRIALQKRERAGVKQSEQPVKLLDERTFG